MIAKSIKTKISIAFFGMLVAVMLASGGVAYFVTDAYLLKSERSKLNLLSQYASNSLHILIQGKKEMLKRITEGDEFLEFLSTYREPILIDYLRRFDDEFPLMSFVNEYGEEELKVVNGERSDKLFDLGEGGLFKDAVSRKNEVVLSEGGKSRTLKESVLRMAIARGGPPGGSFEGMLYAEVPLRHISRMLARYRTGDSAMLALIGRDGRLLASSSSGSAYAGILKDIWDVSAFSSRSNEVVRIDVSGVDSVAAASPVKDTGWVLIASLPYDDFVAGQRSLLISLAVVFALISVVGLFLSPRLSIDIIKPLKRLAESARLVASGDFSARVEVASGDEIGSLAESFNRMMDKLRDSSMALMREKNYSERIIGSMLNALFVTDRYMEIIGVNEAACRLLGYSEPELRGRHIASIFPDEGYWEECAERLFESSRESIETAIMKKDGGKLHVLMSVSEMMEEDARHDGMVFVAQDITEIKEAQKLLMDSHDELEKKVRERTEELDMMNRHLQQEIAERNRAEEELVRMNESLERKNEELREFLFIASHDLQEPLRKIRAFSERLLDKYSGDLDERGLDYLRRMSGSAARMQRLISSLLEFSRVTAAEVALQRVDLGQLLKDVISDLEPTIEGSGGSVQVGDLPVIEADPSQMRRLFQNLIGNALKYRKKDVPPIVRVYVESRGERPDGTETVNIVVEDNGIGFDEKYLDRIFRMFQRLHNMNEYEGTGIGLALCRKIVERHGGELTARSRPGEGSSFIITMPAPRSTDAVAAACNGMELSGG